MAFPSSQGCLCLCPAWRSLCTSTLWSPRRSRSTWRPCLWPPSQSPNRKQVQYTEGPHDVTSPRARVTVCVLASVVNRSCVKSVKLPHTVSPLVTPALKVQTHWCWLCFSLAARQAGFRLSMSENCTLLLPKSWLREDLPRCSQRTLEWLSNQYGFVFQKSLQWLQASFQRNWPRRGRTSIKVGLFPENLISFSGTVEGLLNQSHHSPLCKYKPLKMGLITI